MRHIRKRAGEPVHDKRVASYTVRGTAYYQWGDNATCSEEIGTSDMEVVQGFTGVNLKILEWIDDLHDGEESNPRDFTNKMPSLRTTLSRGKGHCTYRIKYKVGVDRHFIDVEVWAGEVDTAEGAEL